MTGGGAWTNAIAIDTLFDAISGNTCASHKGAKRRGIDTHAITNRESARCANQPTVCVCRACVHAKMALESEKMRYILQFFFDKGTNAAQACNEICAVYGKGAVSKSAARKWFARFRAGNLDVGDAPRSGRPITDRADEIFQLVEQDPLRSSHHIADELNIHHQTVLNHLEKAGCKKKYLR